MTPYTGRWSKPSKSGLLVISAATMSKFWRINVGLLRGNNHVFLNPCIMFLGVIDFAEASLINSLTFSMLTISRAPIVMCKGSVALRLPTQHL